jgi:3,4-dihydroxy 2-butanone 4-phosphate synthase/GTP cyclohydrolase II
VPASQNGSASSSSSSHTFPILHLPFEDRPLDTPTPGFDSISDALEAIAAGELVVVLDDENRENEGDLIAAADRITPEKMTFLVAHSSGVVCVGMEGSDLDRLQIPLMIPPASNEDTMGTAFTVTVDLRDKTSTGISAADRVETIRALADVSSMPHDFKRPGHIFPLRYRPGGVIKRPGHTEASVDLSRLAGCHPAGVLCEVVSADGSMARTPELQAFAKQHGLKCITIADLIRYRLKHDTLVEHTAEATFPTRYGTFTAHSYRSLLDGTEHLALIAGRTPKKGEPILTRIHSESTLGDVFGSIKCDTGPQLEAALMTMAEEGAGVLVYLRGQQGRGLGLADELEGYARCDAAEAAADGSSSNAKGGGDLRDYGVAAHVLKHLGVDAVRLLGESEAKRVSLVAHGIKVIETVPLRTKIGSTAIKGGGSDESQQQHRPSRNGSEHPHFV